MKVTKNIAKEQLKKLGFNIDNMKFTLDDFIYGMNIELEHGSKLGKDTNVTNDCPLKTAKVVLAHMKESPLYYQELKKMETKLENKSKIEKTANILSRKDIHNNVKGNMHLVSGFSGSGKTTLSKKLKGKSKNNILVELDGFNNGKDSTGKEKLVSNFIKDNGLFNKDNPNVNIQNIMSYIEDTAKKNPHKNYIVEGVQFLDAPSELFDNNPTTIKGTGLVKSSFRRLKRDKKDGNVGSNDSIVDAIKYNSKFNKNIDRVRGIVKTAKLNDGIEFNPVQQRVLDNPSNNMIIGHAVGSGKTLSGIAKFEKLKEQGKAKKALVVTPAGLRHNFGNDGIGKFTDSSYNIIGNSSELSKKTGFAPNADSDYNIISYEMFRKDPKAIMKATGADTILADEIHKVRNQGTSTLKSFYDAQDDYKNFIGLTGSVVNNKINDVYNLVDLASRGKHKLGENQKAFDENYLKRSDAPIYADVKRERRPVTGFNQKKMLQSELKKYIDFADDDEVRDIAKIPHKDVSVKKVPLSRQQAKYYKQLVSASPELEKLIHQKKLETLKDDEVSKAFNKMIESRKLMNSVGSVVPGMDLATSAKKTPKTRKLLDDMEKHLGKTPDGQAIILSNMINGGIDVLEAGLKDRGIDYGKFIGKGNDGVTEESRQQDVEDYKARKKKVMLISGAGAEGISLGDTTWEGALDGHYNPERMNQMEARGVRAFGLSHRPEKERRVDVNRYMATMPKTMGIFKSNYKTPDEMIYDIAEGKAKQNKLLFDLLKENNKAPKQSLFQKLKGKITGSNN